MQSVFEARCDARTREGTSEPLMQQRSPFFPQVRQTNHLVDVLLSPPGKIEPHVPGEHEGEPLVQSVHVIFPAPDEIGKLLLCLNGVQGVYNVIAELDKLGQI